MPRVTQRACSAAGVDAYAGHHLISQVIDADQEEGMMVAWGVSEELDHLKLTYHGLPDFLTAVVERELDRIPRHLSSEQRRQLWAILYMPQARLFPAAHPSPLISSMAWASC